MGQSDSGVLLLCFASLRFVYDNMEMAWHGMIAVLSKEEAPCALREGILFSSMPACYRVEELVPRVLQYSTCYCGSK